MTLPRRVRWLAVAVALVAAEAGAQEGRVREVHGQVMRPGPDAARPAARVMVTLHRVGRSGGQPLDSTRTDARGRYSFRYRATGDSAIYFVSASHAGIAYFSAPLRAAVVHGDDADLTVFDTTSAPIPIQQRGRHIVVGVADSAGDRTVIEVYELSNDSSVTRVARGDEPVWDAGLPTGHGGFNVGEGDVSADAIHATANRISVAAPIAPGLKQLSFSYTLSGDGFPLSIPAERATEVLEVLIEDPQGTASGARLAEVDPVEVEGRQFRRFLARDVPANGVVRIDVPAAAPLSRSRYIAVVALALGAALLVVLARAVWGRRGSARPAAPPIPAWANDPDRLARRIAALDAEFEKEENPGAEARETYELQRAELKARLADALAGGKRSVAARGGRE